MNTPPSVYSNMISAQSRRLRTIGLMLILAIVAMTIYGYFGLMPAIDRSLNARGPEVSRPAAAVRSANGSASTPLTREQRVRKFKVATALAYWGVCALLLCGVVLVAWLDLREVTRNYIAQRRAIWNQTAEQLAHKDEIT